MEDMTGSDMTGSDMTDSDMMGSDMTNGTILNPRGQPTHYFDKNGIPYTSALAMLKERTTVLQDEMADHKYLINQALNEYCCIYLKARTMTKYKMVQVAVKARKEDRDFRNKGEWTKSVNGIIEDHIKETLAMADEVKEFLGSIKYLVINKEVEDKLQETIEMLEAKGQEVAGMEKSYTTWDEVEATDDKLSEAVYDFNWVCVSAHNESALE